MLHACVCFVLLTLALVALPSHVDNFPACGCCHSVVWRWCFRFGICRVITTLSLGCCCAACAVHFLCGVYENRIPQSCCYRFRVCVNRVLLLFSVFDMLFAYFCLVLFFVCHMFLCVLICVVVCLCVCCLFVFCVVVLSMCSFVCLCFFVLVMICGFARAGNNIFLINDIVDIIETFCILHLNSYICHIMIWNSLM